MKKLTITIILFILIATGFILSNRNDSVSLDDKDNANNIVKSFIDEMIPHHEEAVETSLKIMSDLSITDAKVRVFAANVVDTQSFEIAKMKNMYTEYLGLDYVASDMNHEMMKLEGLTGDDLAKAYIKDMIKHHEVAVDSAKDYIKSIDRIKEKNSFGEEDGLTITNTHPVIEDTYQLALNIIENQEKEIKELKSW